MTGRQMYYIDSMSYGIDIFDSSRRPAPWASESGSSPSSLTKVCPTA